MRILLVSLCVVGWSSPARAVDRPLSGPLDVMQLLVKQIEGARRAERDLNGPRLNARVRIGGRWHGVQRVLFDKAHVNGQPRGLWLVEGKLQTLTVFGLLEQSGIARIDLHAVLDDGRSIALRIERSAILPRALTGYAVLYRAPAQHRWAPLCGSRGDGLGGLAFALHGYFNDRIGPDGGARVVDGRSFTLACTSHVIGKCVLAGYRPWARRVTCEESRRCVSRALDDLFVACTRMLRADYCGDGRSFTRPGVAVRYADGRIRLAPEVAAGDVPEALWTAKGASCLLALRQPDLAAGCVLPSRCGASGTGTIRSWHER